MRRHYLTLMLTVLFAAGLTVAIGAMVLGGAGGGVPAWALVLPLALALIARRLAR